MATKNDRIYIRVLDEIKAKFTAVAEYRGLKPATLLHSLVVREIHEAQKENPTIFDNLVLEESEDDFSPSKNHKVMTLEEAQADDRKKRKKGKKDK